MVASRPEGLNRKRLEQIRGFIIYVVQTYPTMKPYLIGLHMLIDDWRSNRDAEGWRLSDCIPDSVMIKEEDGNWIPATPDVDDPVLVKAVPRFAGDLEALATLCKADSPRLRAVRCRESGTFLYGFGDASGQAFGASVQVVDEKKYQ
jgi:hypothetical protein